MPRDRMSTIDKLMDDMLFQNDRFFTVEEHKNLKMILTDIHRALSHFNAEAKKKG